MFRPACRLGLEGIVSKRRESPCPLGRSSFEAVARLVSAQHLLCRREVPVHAARLMSARLLQHRAEVETTQGPIPKDLWGRIALVTK